eukprot:TRINITY_DN12745_c0_g1_i1.p1 TRINITY_DN12745_c0_g1~~TRINITY_DN12745_c0_g1_i1.p1  ORF type:complete len:370 (+),score=136.48 TRINITY_DN12745_c0_g1_i1:35-1144(+)
MKNTLLIAFLFIGIVSVSLSQNCGCVKPNCCSKWGYCGVGDNYCKKSNGCQQNCDGGDTTTKSQSSVIPPTKTSIPPPSSNSSNHYVIYIDLPTVWTGSEAEFIVPGSVPNYAYNVVNLAFWTGGYVADVAGDWARLPADKKKAYIAKFHQAGVKVLISAYGSTDMPTGRDPVAEGNKLASFVKDNFLDGVDIDWEDSAAFSPSQAGKGEEWLIKLTQTLRSRLPKPYIISHAPQAPYFVNNPKQYPKGAYLTVHKRVGNLIDYYNVQFYNQGDSTYDTCEKLLNKVGGFFAGTALFEIVANGVEPNKIVVGKPVTRAGATNTGFMEVDLLASCLKQAVSRGWKGGFMGWEYKLDTTGTWSKKLAAAFR